MHVFHFVYTIAKRMKLSKKAKIQVSYHDAKIDYHLRTMVLLLIIISIKDTTIDFLKHW